MTIQEQSARNDGPARNRSSNAVAGSGASSYVKDGSAIYARSFAIIRAEADLDGLSPSVALVAVRMMHACGMTDLVADLVYTPDVADVGNAALRAGAAILCDSQMLTHGITRRRLPANNPVICTLADPRVPALAQRLGTTRSAAALELWREHLAGAVVAIGNAPTALFRLLEMLDEGAPLPAAILGLPVGFVNVTEAKEALIANSRGVPFLTLRGRRGGTAMAAAALNALASDSEEAIS
jgi:precorrin-8X/cobalt-precorrin-8 methylmutase